MIVLKMLLLTALFFSGISSHKDFPMKVKRLDQRIKTFVFNARFMQVQLEEFSTETSSVCISTNFTQVKAKNVCSNSSQLVNQLLSNIGVLEAIREFTYDRHIITPRMHQILKRDTHDAKHIMKF